MEEALTELKTYDWGGDRGSLAGIDQRIVDARGAKKELADIEHALLEVLQSDAKLPAKEYICRQLALIGSDRSVPALSEMLMDPELSDRARLALEAIPGSSAGKALRAALGRVEGVLRVGIVNTLGERRDRKSISVLSKMQDSPDSTLSAAVSAALRKIKDGN